MDKFFAILFFISTCYVSQAQSLFDFDKLLKHDFSQVSYKEIDALDAEIAYSNKDKGLRFNTSVTQNDFAALEAGSTWRINTGLQLDFLRDGIGERKKKVELLEIEKEMKELELELSQKEKNYAYIYNYIIYSFNKEKRKIIEQKKFLLASLINKNFDLYYNHELSFDEILYLKGLDEECDLLDLSMSQVDQVFENLVDVSVLPNLKASDLPILKLHTDSLLAYNPHNHINEIQEFHKRKVFIHSELESQQRLAVYANFHSRPNVANDAFDAGLYTSFGVRYQTPLHFRSKEQKKLVDLQKEVIEAKYDDVKFNHNKELINLVLDYNTKLRQYSNFKYKLEKLYEKRRVETAVQRVSTLGASSKKNWTYDIEILNVTYELMELKQLIYLSLLRIYNKAKLTEILPYVDQLLFDESQQRFDGKRILKITMDEIRSLDKEFIMSYLQKNNFDYVLCIDAYDCDDLVTELYRNGIKFYNSAELLQQNGIVIVPAERFTSRSEMELWINYQLDKHPDHFLLFEKIEKLVSLDNKTIGE